MCQYMGWAWWGGGGELKMLLKNTCEWVHLLVKVPAISLQACKFTKNELVHAYFLRILARFYVIIYCAFSRNHFIEGAFTFQWGACFSDGGFIFNPQESIGFDGGRFKKIVGWGGGRPSYGKLYGKPCWSFCEVDV